MTPRPSDPDKKQKIIQAVQSVLARKGYGGATVSEVAEEAGVSRGLLHYYFKNKDEMMSMAARENLEAAVSMVHLLFRTAHTGDDLGSMIIQGFKRLMENDPGFFIIFLESWAVTRHNQAIADECRDLYRRFKLALVEGIEAARATGVLPAGKPAFGIAAVIAAVLDGLGLQLLTEPELMDNNDVLETAASALRHCLLR